MALFGFRFYRHFVPPGLKTGDRSGLPKARSSLCPPSPLKVMPMAHHTRTPVPMPKNSQANIHRIIKGGIGHNVPQEAPQDFAKAVVEVDSY